MQLVIDLQHAYTFNIQIKVSERTIAENKIKFTAHYNTRY